MADGHGLLETMNRVIVNNLVPMNRWGPVERQGLLMMNMVSSRALLCFALIIAVLGAVTAPTPCVAERGTNTVHIAVDSDEDERGHGAPIRIFFDLSYHMDYRIRSRVLNLRQHVH